MYQTVADAAHAGVRNACKIWCSRAFRRTVIRVGALEHGAYFDILMLALTAHSCAHCKCQWTGFSAQNHIVCFLSEFARITSWRTRKSMVNFRLCTQRAHILSIKALNCSVPLTTFLPCITQQITRLYPSYPLRSAKPKWSIWLQA